MKAYFKKNKDGLALVAVSAVAATLIVCGIMLITGENDGTQDY